MTGAPDPFDGEEPSPSITTIIFWMLVCTGGLWVPAIYFVKGLFDGNH